MSVSPAELTLDLQPRSRLDVIDVCGRIADEHGDLLGQYQRALFCSHHTTAGFLEQSLMARMGHCPDSAESFVTAFQQLFPPNADYRHDQLHLREELSEEQRANEPLNGDSHLTFIGSGLNNCVTYNRPSRNPVYFIDLDGVYRESVRTRRATVIGFDHEEEVGKLNLEIPVSAHPVDSVNLRDARLGVFELLDDVIRRCGIVKGRIDVTLHGEESHAGLTVNEYETLLMRHDLAEVLQNPLRFVAEKGRNLLLDPMAIPGKTLNYAKYDLVRLVNGFIDAMNMNDSAFERLVDKFLAVPAARFLRMKRGVSLLVSDRTTSGKGEIVQGTYQSPILVQWDRASDRRTRRLEVTFVRFN